MLFSVVSCLSGSSLVVLCWYVCLVRVGFNRCCAPPFAVVCCWLCWRLVSIVGRCIFVLLFVVAVVVGGCIAFFVVHVVVAVTFAVVGDPGHSKQRVAATLCVAYVVMMIPLVFIAIVVIADIATFVGVAVGT